MISLWTFRSPESWGSFSKRDMETISALNKHHSISITALLVMQSHPLDLCPAGTADEAGPSWFHPMNWSPGNVPGRDRSGWKMPAETSWSWRIHQKGRFSRCCPSSELRSVGEHVSTITHVWVHEWGLYRTSEIGMKCSPTFTSPIGGTTL